MNDELGLIRIHPAGWGNLNIRLMSHKQPLMGLSNFQAQIIGFRLFSFKLHLKQSVRLLEYREKPDPLSKILPDKKDLKFDDYIIVQYFYGPLSQYFDFFELKHHELVSE